jgi:predicted RNA binding protein YcfA (HicA-like mRNA interferase family)
MTPRLPPLKPRRTLRALKRAGFFVDRTKGSHYPLKHPDNPALRVIVPYHTKDLKRKTLNSIIRQAGLTPDEFSKFL